MILMMYLINNKEYLFLIIIINISYFLLFTEEILYNLKNMFM